VPIASRHQKYVVWIRPQSLEGGAHLLRRRVFTQNCLYSPARVSRSLSASSAISIVFSPANVPAQAHGLSAASAAGCWPRQRGLLPRLALGLGLTRRAVSAHASCSSSRLTYNLMSHSFRGVRGPSLRATSAPTGLVRSSPRRHSRSAFINWRHHCAASSWFGYVSSARGNRERIPRLAGASRLRSPTVVVPGSGRS